VLVHLDALANCFENRLVNFLSSDIATPKVDSGEVAARIQSDPALHRTPIAFLTAL
jgi:CheY-like chemotaxis protein